jgi:hypothetical protein
MLHPLYCILVTTQAAVKFKNKTLDKPTTPNYNIREDFG